MGLSANPDRPSYGVAQYLQHHGYRIIPVNPNESEVLGETSYPSLNDVPVPIDVVNIFRRPDAVPPIVNDAIAIGAQTIWMQLGIEHPEAAAHARAAGLNVIENRCMAVEHLHTRRADQGL